MKEKWYQKNRFIIVSLIFFFPVGLTLMWVFKKWNLAARIIVSVFFGIMFILSIFMPQEEIVTDDSNLSKINTTEKKQTEEKDSENKEKTKNKTKEVSEKAKIEPKITENKTLNEEEYKGIIKSYRQQIQLAGEDLMKLSNEMNSSGKTTNKGKDLVYAIYGSLDSADFILKGAKKENIPPNKFKNDHQELLNANQHFQNASTKLKDFEQSQNISTLNDALKEMQVASEDADINIRNILEQ